jgi:tetratricopeptide (TPR) repeat protein
MTRRATSKRSVRAVVLALLSLALSSAIASAQGEPPPTTDAPPPPTDAPPPSDVPEDDAPEDVEPEILLGGSGDFDVCTMITPGEGEASTPEEWRAWCNADQHNYIRARELAEAVVRANPNSYVGNFVLGYVHQMGEANSPRALFFLRRALDQYTHAWGDPPMPGGPWRWHARMLQELSFVEGDLENYDEQIAYMNRYNASYDPDMAAEAAWPLMKMRRFDDARRVARAALSTGDSWQVEVALNALCAVEFEAGDEQRSHEACRAALDLHGADPARQSAVDFTNFAESSRSLFRLDEAEEVGLQATRAQVAWFGNPYVELAELYVREARFPEALDMLRQVHPYRLRRPPHVQDVDRNEARRALSEFFVVVGRGEDAVRITSKAVNMPDRRSHNSRDSAQDLAVAAILDRVARRIRADEIENAALGESIVDRTIAWGQASLERYEGWTSGRQAARALADTSRLVGIFQIGRARSGILPPWLAGDLASILGPGVTIEAIRRARADDDRPGSDAYYDAFEAEAMLEAGDAARAYELARRAHDALGPAESLLRARTSAIAAEAAMREDRREDALAAYDEAFQIDPGIWIRMDLAVPVRIVSHGGAVADTCADLLASSPRFDVADIGMAIDVEPADAHGRACMTTSTGAVLGCGELDREGAETADEFAARLARALIETAFAPRIDMSQTDAAGLDGSNVTAQGGLRSLLDQGEPLDEP